MEKPINFQFEKRTKEWSKERRMYVKHTLRDLNLKVN